MDTLNKNLVEAACLAIEDSEEYKNNPTWIIGGIVEIARVRDGNFFRCEVIFINRLREKDTQVCMVPCGEVVEKLLEILEEKEFLSK